MYSNATEFNNGERENRIEQIIIKRHAVTIKE
jgi:hypothetical protein